MARLERFLDGQRFGYETALIEMKAGKKQGHWIWYIFPQIKGLGHSPNSNYYAIEDINEAKAYLEHPILGSRLRNITLEVLKHADKGIDSIMGVEIDVMKFKSSMTLFDAASPDDIFAQTLDIFYDGMRDRYTLDILLANKTV